MLVPLHDSMPSFMNFRRVLDLLEYKKKYLNVLSAINSGHVFEFIPISCMGPKHAPQGHIFDFSTNLYALEHVHVVKI